MYSNDPILELMMATMINTRLELTGIFVEK